MSKPNGLKQISVFHLIKQMEMLRKKAPSGFFDSSLGTTMAVAKSRQTAQDYNQALDDVLKIVTQLSSHHQA